MPSTKTLFARAPRWTALDLGPDQVRRSAGGRGRRRDALHLAADFGEIVLHRRVFRRDADCAREIALRLFEPSEEIGRSAAGAKRDGARGIDVEHPLAVAQRFRVTAALELEHREVRADRAEVGAVLEPAFERVLRAIDPLRGVIELEERDEDVLRRPGVIERGVERGLA